MPSVRFWMSQCGQDPEKRYSHNADFSQIKWKGRVYILTKNQSVILRVLTEATDTEFPAVLQKDILFAMGNQLGKMASK